MDNPPEFVTIDPKKIKELNAASPGGGDAFLKELIAQLETDRLLLQAKHQSDQAARTRGQYLGFTIAVLGLAAGLTAALHGAEIAGSVLGGATVVSLVCVFVLGRVPGLKPKT